MPVDEIVTEPGCGSLRLHPTPFPVRAARGCQRGFRVTWWGRRWATVTEPDMPSEIKQPPLLGLEDSDYRRVFTAEHLNLGLAYQLRLLREDRGWTQEELARRTGKSQEMISRWEDPDYGSHSISTLKVFADAFDVALIVRFAPFSELTKWLTSLSIEQLVPKGFEEESQNRGIQPLG